MKKLLAGFLSVCLLFSVAGCGAAPIQEAAPSLTEDLEQAPSGSTTKDIQQPTPDTPSMHALSMPTVKEEAFSEDGTLLFTMSFPRFQMFLGDQALEEAIIGDLQQRMNGILTASEEVYAAAQEDYLLVEPADWQPYSYGVAYTPTRLDQTVMSLFGNRSRYSGGAHPAWVTDSVTYDLQTGTALELADILCTGYSNDKLCSLVLKALSDKAQTLSFGYEEIVTQRFADGSDQPPQWYFSRTGLCFHFPPYDIAPYSSGTVIAEIPYQQLEGLLQEQYFPCAAAIATGSMYAQSHSEVTSSGFTFMAEVELTESDTPIVLYSDATVTDMRIETGTVLDDDGSFISTGVVFMADAVRIGEGITLHADLSDTDTVLRLVYRSADHEVSSLITWDPSSGNVVLTSK